LRIWQRYLFGHLIRTFLFFLFCIFILYILIDFSMHGPRFLSKETTSWLEIGIHYLRHFAKFTNLFFSLSFLLSLLRVLIDLTAHREIVALQTAGISSRRLLTPFFLLAALLAIASYANSEWISPDAQTDANRFYKAHSKHGSRLEKVFFQVLQDGSELVYQKYNPEKQELFDVFWIRSFDEIWHMKTICISERPLQARFAERFVRSRDGALEKAESAEARPFPEIPLEAKTSFASFIPFEDRSLSALCRQATGGSADQPRSAAHLHYKLALPVIPFLLALSFSPFALRFSRGRRTFLFIACSLFAFLGFMTLLDAQLILAENQVMPPSLAIWGPVATFFALALFFFSRIR